MSIYSPCQMTVDDGEARIGHGSGCAVHGSVVCQGLQRHNTRCGALNGYLLEERSNRDVIECHKVSFC